LTAEALRDTGLGGALRAGAVDLYYHSIRMVPANLAWGLGFAGVLFVAVSLGPVALLGAPLLALPLVGVARLAGLIARHEEVVLSDAWAAARDLAGPALIAGSLGVGATAALTTNIAVGVANATPLGLSLAVLAAWGLVGLGLLAFPFWVLLGDPARAAWSVIDVGRLTGMLLLVHPLRLVGLGMVVAAALLIGAILVAALLTVAVAYAALVTAHRILPAADRLSAGTPTFPPLALAPPVTEPVAAD
jgi:hypothetical protein